MRARRRSLRAAARPALALVVGSLALLLGAAGTASSRLVVHSCIAADGAVGILGMRLAVLRRAADCPDGSLGLSRTGTGAVLMLSIAVPLVVAFAALALVGLSVLTLLTRVTQALRHLLRPLAAALPAPLALPERRPAAPAPATDPPLRRELVASIARRGPPLAV